MATLVIHPATSYQPAEAISTAPTHCATCRHPFDEDEDGDLYGTVDGRNYCAEPHHGPSCLQIARKSAYLTAAAEIAKEKITAALEALYDVTREYKQDVATGDPYLMLDDAADRINAFAKGQDNGWRNDLMMDWAEATELTSALRSACGARLLGPVPADDAPIYQPTEAELRNLRAQVRKLDAIMQRTQEGARQ